MNSPKLHRIEVREAFKDEFDAVIKFVNQEKKKLPEYAKDFFVRPDAVYKSAIKKEKCYIMKEGDDIVGIGCILPFDDFERGAFELGSLFVKREYQGQILELLAPIGMAAALVQENPSAKIYAIAARDGPSKPKIEELGFEVVPETDARVKRCINEFCEHKPPDKICQKKPKEDLCCVTYLEIAAADLCKRIAEFLSSKRTVDKPLRSGGTMRIEHKTPLYGGRYQNILQSWRSENCIDSAPGGVDHAGGDESNAVQMD